MESYSRFDEIFQEIEKLNKELQSTETMGLQEMMEKARQLKALTQEGNQILEEAKDEIQTIYLDLEEQS